MQVYKLVAKLTQSGGEVRNTAQNIKSTMWWTDLGLVITDNLLLIDINNCEYCLHILAILTSYPSQVFDVLKAYDCHYPLTL